MSGDVLVIKLGGSVMTDKDAAAFTAEQCAVDVAALVRGCWQHGRRVVLVLGAGSAGHALAKRFGFSSRAGRPLDEPATTLEALRVHQTVAALGRHVVEERLCAAGVPAQLVSFAAWDADSDAFRTTLKQSLATLLAHAVVPVCFGDMQLRQGEAWVLSGDTIAPLLADVLDAPLLLMLSAHAVHDRDPTRSADARLVTHIGVRTGHCHVAGSDEGVPLSTLAAGESTARHDVTGGMQGKLASVLAFCEQPRRKAVVVGVSDCLEHLGAIVRGELGHRYTTVSFA